MDPSIFYGKKRQTNKGELLTRIINNASDSEDSLLSDSDMEDEVVEFEKTAVSEVHENDNISTVSNEELGQDEVESDSEIETDLQPAETNKKKKNKKREIKWAFSRSRQIRPIFPWKGNLPDTPVKLETPYTYFQRLIDGDILEHIVEQSNLFAIETDPTKPLSLSVVELEKFMGITFLMSIYGLPRTRMFWQQETKVSKVADTMSRNRWEQIKSRIHFNDNVNSHDSNDKLFKIRPFVDKVVQNFKKIPIGEKGSVDEQMIPFKGRHSIKQYIKSKPKKWGYKAFVLCGSDGIVYNWELYTGAINQDPELSDIGVSGNVVLRLAKIIPKNNYHKIYFDNWFNSIDLQIQLYNLGILSLGTVRSNRLEGCTFTDDKTMKKKGRGTMEEIISVVDGVELLATKWYDNKPVHLLSSFAGIYPTKTVKRWDSKTETRIDVECPNAVTVYNQFMGGVDLVDSLIALYRTTIRSKKWYHKIYFHLLDLCVVNSWLIYKRDCNLLQISKKDRLSLLQFKSQIASTLCDRGDEFSNKKRRGRSSSSGVQQENCSNAHD